MKKTLITLLALAGIAPAITTTTSTITLSDVTKTDAVIVTAELSLQNLTDILWTNSTNRGLIGLTDNGNHSWATIVGTWGGKQEMLITAGIKGGEAFSSAGDLYYSGSDWPTDKNVGGYFSSANAVKGAITLAYGGSNVTGTGDEGTSILVSVLYEDGTIKSLYGNRNGYKFSNNSIKEVSYTSELMSTPDVLISNTKWTADSLKAIHNQLLTPEPATATLSLLALAGLAARRRRK